MNTKLSKLIAHRDILVHDLNKNIRTSTARNVTKAIEQLDILIRVINLGNEPTDELVTKKSVRYVTRKENLSHLMTDRRISTTVGWLTLKNIYFSTCGVGSMASITLGVHTIYAHLKSNVSSTQE